MVAYYNEIDPYAAQWLRNLIAAGHIAPGDVDERSIVDVSPDDFRGYTQCHFFAGIGGWSYAARLAGWPDDRPLWTGSCPCQPFSIAGKGEGQTDARHLWPEFFRLIGACRPDVVMGEQVAAAVGKDWLDGVHSDLEGIGYACGAAVVPACAVDAPHRRDRLWFVADPDTTERRPDMAGRHDADRETARWNQGDGDVGQCGRGDAMADTVSGAVRDQPRRGSGPDGSSARIDSDIKQGAVALAERSGRQGRQPDAGYERSSAIGAPSEASALVHAEGERRGEGRTEPELRSWWSTTAGAGVSFIAGADGKARRVEPGIRLLAHGVPARVGKLRAYGNAIVPQVAAEIIGAYLDTSP